MNITLKLLFAFLFQISICFLTIVLFPKVSVIQLGSEPYRIPDVFTDAPFSLFFFILLVEIVFELIYSVVIERTHFSFNKFTVFIPSSKSIKIFSQDESYQSQNPLIADEFYAADLAGHILMAILLKIPFEVKRGVNSHCKVTFQYPGGTYNCLKERCLIHYAGLTARQMLFTDICKKRPAWSLENCMDNPAYLCDEHVSSQGHVISSYFAASLPDLLRWAYL